MSDGLRIKPGLDLDPRGRELLSDRIERLARERDAGRRLLLHARALSGTPFISETMLDDGAPDAPVIRLRSFDCSTFVYTALALAHCWDVESFVRTMLNLRYHDWRRLGTADDARTGNKYYFPSEVFLESALGRSTLRNVTQRVFTNAPIRMLHHARAATLPLAYDRSQRLVRTRAAGLRPIGFTPLPIAAPLAWQGLRDGDIVLLTKPPFGRSTFVADHMVIVDRAEGVHFLHATRHFRCVRLQEHETHLSTTGKTRGFVQIGVGFGTERLEGEPVRFVDGQLTHFYHADRRRDLADYATENFAGVCVLRTTNGA